MKVLVLLDEIWSDEVHPNNTMSNWFLRFEDVEVAAICCSPGVPLTDCCSDFFQITDRMMLKSLFSNYKAGIILTKQDKPEEKNFYGTKKNWYHNELFRIIRSFIWRYGKYNISELKKYLEMVNPDIIFTQRKGSIKLARLELLVKSIIDVPIVAFTGDDEYSLKQIEFNPLWWMHRLWIRSWLRKTYRNYKLFYCSSYKQAEEFHKKFGMPTKFLVKVGDFDKSYLHSFDNCPIRIVYAGKLYCNRYKSLLLLAKVINKINKQNKNVLFCLDIYAPEATEKRYQKCFDDFDDTTLHQKVTKKQLDKIYDQSDILVHAESLDLKNSLLTRHSFSTKLIDCLGSGAATLVISKEYHSGYVYCKKNKIAFTASSEIELENTLLSIADNKNSLFEMAEAAMNYGARVHERKRVQSMLYSDFSCVINDYIKGE